MILFLVGRTMTDDAFQFQGIFDSQQKAEAACRDETYFVGTCELNQEIPHEVDEWPEAWYPRLETRADGVARMETNAPRT